MPAFAERERGGRHPALGGVCRHDRHRGRSEKCQDRMGPCYSIVSSARARNVGGIVRLSAVLWESSRARSGVGPRVPALHEPKKCFRPKVQNSFWITEDKFSRLWTRRTNNRVGDRSNRAAALLTDQFVRSKTFPPRERQ